MSKSDGSSPKSVEAEPVKSEKIAKKRNVGSIFWGLLFVLVGTLLLLDNLGIVKVNLWNVWELWPVIIIGIGLSFLSLRGWLSALISLVAIVALLGLVVFVLVDGSPYPDTNKSSGQTTTLSDAADGAKRLKVGIDTGAANIVLSSSRERKGVEVSQSSDFLRLVKKTETKGDTRHVLFSTDFARRGFQLGGANNKLQVDLTRSLPVALEIDTGATSVSGDLSQVRLTSLDIDTGASSIDLRLGALEQRQDVTLDAGASSIILHIPKQAGVRVESNSGLTKLNFDGIDKVSESTYESLNFASSDRQIIIHADLGVSGFEIRKY